ncbi:MAG: cadmium-translocating P-type ATPase [Oscillospiraceae bacterium]|nr:cadmium-translocating P-type ATPase [Oscillospiraceae bacterium]
MELVYTLKGLDCPNCSAKIEKEVGALEQITEANVNLMQQTLTVKTAHAAEEIRELIKGIVHKHEPDVEVIAKGGHAHHHDHAQVLTYTLKGLDCPNCSAKIEQEVGALEQITEANVNLMQQTLTVKTAHAAEEIHELIEGIVHKHEPDVEVIAKGGHAHEHHHDHEHEHGHCCEHEHEHEHEHSHAHEHAHAHAETRTAKKPDRNRVMTLRILAGAAVFAVGAVMHYLLHAPAMAVFAVMLVSYIILGWDVVWTALRNITKGQIFDEHFLMSISTIGAFALGEYPEAAAVMLFYQVGEFFQSLAVQRSRKSISALLDIRPDTANVLRGGTVSETAAEDVCIGEQIIVRAGERVPLDGVVTEGESMLDTTALTGESVPRHVRPGDEALSGCINQSGTLTVRVTKPFSESTASKIIDMVENAAARKAPTENFITTFARYYTPVIVILAVLLAVVPPLLLHGVWAEWIRRAFVFLIVSCPCALVISIPLTFFGGIGAASKHGVLVKGSNDLEALSKVRAIVFDKTGTLTKGEFNVAQILPAEGVSQSELLKYAAGCERNSNHPIASSILAAYPDDVNALTVTDSTEISGYGLQATVEGRKILAGSGRLMEKKGIDYPRCEGTGTKVYLAADGKYLGCILIADSLKPDVRQTLSGLRGAGISQMVMLTGDNKEIADAVAKELKLDACYAELLPENKVEKLEAIAEKMPEGEKLAFVGDGINDAPVLARADVGIAMGALGADAAIEAADVVLMTDEPARLGDAIRVAKQTKQIVMQNIIFALGVKILLLILGACGLVGMWWAVFGDVGVTVLAVLNAMRMLRK